MALAPPPDASSNRYARVQVISSAGSQELGRSLTTQELESLSEEQKLQVLKIAEESVKSAPGS